MTQPKFRAFPAFAVVSLFSTWLLASACGADDTPSEDELIEAIEAQDDFDADAAECIAERILESDLTSAQLRAIVDDDVTRLSTESQDEAAHVLVTSISECTT